MSVTRPSSGHRRADSDGRHHRHTSSSSSAGHHRPDSGCEPSERRHQRSKSGVHERERNDSVNSQISNKIEFRSAQSGLQEGHVYTRPTSLFPIRNHFGSSDATLQPEREPIKFDVNLAGAPPEVEQLVSNIKHVAEQFLYHWKTFPIILPNPVSQCDSFSTSQISSDGSLGRCKTKYHLRDLFVAPSFDELDAVAVDGKGETRRLTGKQLEYIRERGLHKDKFGKPKRLNHQQLESIRREGEFEVESLNFPGQQHRWKLSELLQKGIERTRHSLLNDLALALRFIFVTAKGRLISHFFSFHQAVHALFSGFLRILDLVFGVPSLQAHNLDAKIREERTKYLVAELVCRSENEESLEQLCAYIRKQLRRAATEKFEVTKECTQTPVAVPYRYLTPAGVELDLRLWDRALMRKAIPLLVAILERETRGWFLHFRERLIADLRAQKLPDHAIERLANDAVAKEYLQRVYASILANADLASLGEQIPLLLVQQAQSVVLMHRAVESVHTRLTTAQDEFRARLFDLHPVLSRIEPWLRAKLRAAEARFSLANQWSAHQEALQLCSQQSLHQTVYFLNRDLAFMREREPALLRELRKVKTPTRSFLWPTQIWLPNNWLIRRNFQGQSDTIPTILSTHATSITTPRSDPTQPVYLVEKELVRTTTTRWPFWRFFNYFHRTWCWTWNAMFFFGILLPWCSPVGIRALFSLEPFMPDLELSQVNGTLFPRKSSVTSSLCSRLITLWRHISKSRTHFETKPDTGFIGKGLTRHLNRIWNYLIKGLFGTILLVVIFPVVCLCVIVGSFAIALTAIFWMPVLTVLVQVSNALFYDLDCPEQHQNRFFVLFEAIIWQIAIQGIVQPIVALLVAFVLCPLAAVVILIGGIVRYWLRLAWDACIFHLIIKKRGRVPASDSFVVRRIAGPGLAADYYFQISAEQALAAFEAKMEWDELDAYESSTEAIIMQPQRDFEQFVEACFGCFSTQLAPKNGVYQTLEKEAADLISLLHEKLERRRRDLQTGLSMTVKSKIKLETNELKTAIQQGALLLERFYPLHVLPRLACTADQMWEARALAPGDWPGLAAHLYADLFSLDVLAPLDPAAASFRLEPHPAADLARLAALVQGARAPAALPVGAPRGGVRVRAPSLEVGAFNPRAKQPPRPAVGGGAKMAIPLGVPHPAHIAVTIYNRDSDEPIPLEAEVCQCVLRGIEESHVVSQETVISRYKGGGDSYETSSSSETLDDSPPVRIDDVIMSNDGAYQWTLSSNWGQLKRNNSGSVKVDLASPEDVTLDSDSTRVVFSTYGTTV